MHSRAGYWRLGSQLLPHGSHGFAEPSRT